MFQRCVSEMCMCVRVYSRQTCSGSANLATMRLPVSILNTYLKCPMSWIDKCHIFYSKEIHPLKQALSLKEHKYFRNIVPQKLMLFFKGERIKSFLRLNKIQSTVFPLISAQGAYKIEKRHCLLFLLISTPCTMSENE